MLAFDHRSSFSRDLLGIPGEPTPEEAARVADLKRLVYEGFEAALAAVVDEQYGADVAHRARSRGVVLAMPAERSGRDEFELEFGDDFDSHIDDFDPTFVKVLVRYTPAGDRESNRRQAARLAALSEWLRAHDRKLLFELLVPPKPEADLVVQAMRELRDAGVEPDIWKIEGLERREDCERAAAQARAGGRDHVTCLVLGRGADEAKVVHWLRQAAGVPGFVGFAVGRTLWWDELVAYVGGAIDRAEAAARIAGNYGRLIAAWEQCTS
jgi:myo-inositol catabolism protein IolC